MERSNKLIFGSNLHILRAKKRMTQEQLAQKIGVTRGTIIAIEKGDYNPSLELAFKLSIFFNTSIHEIFYLQGDQKDEQEHDKN